MEKKLCLILYLLLALFIYSEEKVIDITMLDEYQLQPLQEGDELVSKKIGTKQGFELEFSVKDINGNRKILGKFMYFSGWITVCSNNVVYFSISNSKNNIIPSIYKYDVKKGKIQRIINALLFTSTEDGRYICYSEPWQIKKEYKHLVSYWYIFDTISGKSANIVNEKSLKNYEINGAPKFDKTSYSFLLEVGYDNVVVETLAFNPTSLNYE